MEAMVPATAVRWRIVAMLAGFSLVSYALRTNISIAAALMRSDLHLTQTDLGHIFSAFLIGYAVFQAPDLSADFADFADGRHRALHRWVRPPFKKTT